LLKYKTETDKKYNRYITKLARQYTHPRRDRETEVGRLFADIYRDALGLDIMFHGSGALRTEKFGPVVLFHDLSGMCPYDEEVYRVGLTGAQLKHAIEFILRPEALASDHSEFYQYSAGLHFVYSTGQQKLLDITFEGEPIDDARVYNIGAHKYHFNSMKEFWDISEEEIKRNKMPRLLATSSLAILDEWMSSQKLITVPDEPRWVMTE